MTDWIHCDTGMGHEQSPINLQHVMSITMRDDETNPKHDYYQIIFLLHTGKEITWDWNDYNTEQEDECGNLVNGNSLIRDEIYEKIIYGMEMKEITLG